MAKEAEKLEFALGQIPEKNLEERQVLVDKIQAIKEVLHVSKWSDPSLWSLLPSGIFYGGDSRGLQIGTLDKGIQRVMVALDIREETVAEAIEKGVDLIIVKHAPIFRPIKDLLASRPQNQIYIDLIKHDIAVYVSHTNIDIVENGLNDWFCQMLGIEETTYLQETGPERGIGRIGNIQPQTFWELAQQVKQVFDLDSLRMVHYQENDLQKPISRVAICGGSGQSFYKDALAKGQMSISLVISTTILLRICCLMAC